jgi:hypothetical protein
VSGAIFVVLAVLIGWNATRQATLPAPLSWSEGRFLETTGSVADAALAYEDALAEDPTNAGLLLSISNFYGRHGLPRRQAAILEAVLALPGLEPDSRVLAHEGLARAYLGIGDLPRAREHVRSAMEVHVDDCEWEGRPYFAMGLVPATDCKLRLLAARVEIAAGNLATAGSLVEDALRQCPSSAEVGSTARSLAGRIRSLGLAGQRHE